MPRHLRCERQRNDSTMEQEVVVVVVLLVMVGDRPRTRHQGGRKREVGRRFAQLA